MPAPSSQRAAWLPWTLVPLAVVGVSALWLLAALYSERQCSWMAVVAAFDALWVLGFGRPIPPARRAVLAVIATVTTVLLVNWILAATYAGGQVGLAPWEAAIRLGPGHARTLVSLANAWQDQVWLVVALAVAAAGPFLSDRLRAPSAR